MGMFDYFKDLDGKLPCAAGHTGIAWQTKSLEDTMTTYYLFGGRLFVRERRGTEGSYHIAEDGTLRQPCERVATPVVRTLEVEVHGGCPACRPVLHADRHGVVERDPYCEYVLTFVRGELQEVKAHRLDTREQIIHEITAAGGKVFADDSPMAIVHNEKRASKPRGYFGLDD